VLADQRRDYAAPMVAIGRKLPFAGGANFGRKVNFHSFYAPPWVGVATYYADGDQRRQGSWGGNPKHMVPLNPGTPYWFLIDDGEPYEEKLI